MGIEVAMKTIGEYFGEMGLLSDCERTAFVQSRMFSLVATLKREDLVACLEGSPDTKLYIFGALTKAHLKATTGSTIPESRDEDGERTPLIGSVREMKQIV